MRCDKRPVSSIYLLLIIRLKLLSSAPQRHILILLLSLLLLSLTHYYNNFSSFTSTNRVDMRTNQLSKDRCYVCFQPLLLSLVRQSLVYRSQFCVDFTNKLKQLTVYPRFELICFHDRGSIYLGKTEQRQALHHHPQLPGKKYHTQTRIFNGGFMCVISRYSTAIL